MEGQPVEQPLAGEQGLVSQQEISLATKDLQKARKQRGTKKHWVVRACVNLAMVDISLAEVQSAIRESVYITPAIANQLRYMTSFDLFAYVPRDATFTASDMTALPPMDRFALLRDSLLTVLHLDLNNDVPEDAEPLNRISHLEASFNEISNKFRRFLTTYYSVVRGRMLVLAGAISRDIGVWESDLSTFVGVKYSGAMTPGASTVLEMFPLPAWKGMTDFVNMGGECWSPCNPRRFPPLPPRLQHPAAASTLTSAPPPTVTASSSSSTVTAG